MYLKEFDLVFRKHAYIFTQISRYFHCILIVFLYLNNIQQRLVAPFVMRQCKLGAFKSSLEMSKGALISIYAKGNGVTAGNHRALYNCTLSSIEIAKQANK